MIIEAYRIKVGLPTRLAPFGRVIIHFRKNLWYELAGF